MKLLDDKDNESIRRGGGEDDDDGEEVGVDDDDEEAGSGVALISARLGEGTCENRCLGDVVGLEKKGRERTMLARVRQLEMTMTK